jgi:hypothetical protein
MPDILRRFLPRPDDQDLSLFSHPQFLLSPFTQTF